MPSDPTGRPLPGIASYTDRFSVGPGETLPIRVSSEVGAYRADLVRLISAETARDGSGFREEVVPSVAASDHPGRRQELRPGSVIVIPDAPPLRIAGAFTITLFLQPTLPDVGRQTLLARAAADGTGYALEIDPQHGVVLSIGARSAFTVATGIPLHRDRWYFVAASVQPGGDARIIVQPLPTWPVETSGAVLREPVPADVRLHPAVTGTPLTIAARPSADGGLGSFLNGRIASPAIFADALTIDQLTAIRRGADAASVGGAVVAAWDFRLDIASDRIHDTGPFALHGRTVNLPTRAMTDHTWTGQSLDWTRDPGPYGAIHFHDDDLSDAGWEADFELTLPGDLPTGIYAARLAAVDGTWTDRLPLFVRPPAGTATSPLLFLQSTNTHLAYANWHANLTEEWAILRGRPWPYPLPPEKVYGEHHQLLSLYDRHTDGSGVSTSSPRRPILNMRPTMNDELSWDGLGWAHGVKADLQVAGWLTERGLSYDIASDEDLDGEGVDLLARYRCVLTGTHPEYWTLAMLDAAEAYLARGGRFIYLGGNGLYWVTSYVPGEPGVIEVRRSGGTQAWTANVGEEYHASTGELGGVWRQRGRAPQRLVGVGFAAQGGGRARPYLRTEASHDPRAAWIFDGVGDDEPIGSEGLVMDGAAGFEIDRADVALGTPPHALIVASATGFDDLYQHVTEEVPSSNSRQGGSVEPRVRADLTYFETPNGGAVFATGSIAWGGALWVDGGVNPVARVTENVLRGFLRDGPLPGHAAAGESSHDEGSDPPGTR